MKYQLTDQEQAIVTLREEQRLSFRAIGELLELSPNKTSYIYHQTTRKLRHNRFHELREEQNQIIVSFPLMVGEVVILRRILFLFQKWKRGDCRGNHPEFQELKNDPEYLAAEDMEKRLAALERAARTGRE